MVFTSFALKYHSAYILYSYNKTFCFLITLMRFIALSSLIVKNSKSSSWNRPLLFLTCNLFMNNVIIVWIPVLKRLLDELVSHTVLLPSFTAVSRLFLCCAPRRRVCWSCLNVCVCVCVYSVSLLYSRGFVRDLSMPQAAIGCVWLSEIFPDILLNLCWATCS